MTDKEKLEAINQRVRGQGAPGDYGYNTEMGKFLFDLYRLLAGQQ